VGRGGPAERRPIEVLAGRWGWSLTRAAGAGASLPSVAKSARAGPTMVVGHGGVRRRARMVARTLRFTTRFTYGRSTISFYPSETRAMPLTLIQCGGGCRRRARSCSSRRARRADRCCGARPSDTRFRIVTGSQVGRAKSQSSASCSSRSATRWRPARLLHARWAARCKVPAPAKGEIMAVGNGAC